MHQSHGCFSMNLYRFGSHVHILEQGECNCDAALETFERCYMSGCVSHGSAEDAYAATSFGLSRSRTDFIEISCHGHDSVTVHSDRLCYPSRLNRFFASKRSLFVKGDKAMGTEIICDYFAMDRPAFEGKYAAFLYR